MKHLSNQILLTLFMFVVGTETSAANSDFSAKNEDGINVDTYFTNLLKEKNLWKYTK